MPRILVKIFQKQSKKYKPLKIPKKNKIQNKIHYPINNNKPNKQLTLIKTKR